MDDPDFITPSTPTATIDVEDDKLITMGHSTTRVDRSPIGKRVMNRDSLSPKPPVVKVDEPKTKAKRRAPPRKEGVPSTPASSEKELTSVEVEKREEEKRLEKERLEKEEKKKQERRKKRKGKIGRD